MIRIDNLHKTYVTPHGRHEALRGIDLHVVPGEVFGIIGPSGAGKSTLVQCINLLERPDQGSIVIAGQVLTGLGERRLREQRRRIGMVFQGFNLLARRTVYGNVALPLEIAGVPAREIAGRVDRLLDLVGLAHLRERYPSQISGGQKQRVGIARALANAPDVLLSDEATSALDPETTRTILSLLREINRRTGITVVLITHQMEVVQQICDRVAVMDKGQIVEQGATAELFASPRHAVTRAMVSAVTACELGEEALAELRRRAADAVRADCGQAAGLWRVVLGGGSSDALLSALAREYGVALQIVQARVESIQGNAVGTLFVLARGQEQALAAACAAAAAHQATIEEIFHEPATDRSPPDLAA